MSCACGDRWRIEACQLSTGLVRAVLHPVGFNWQLSLDKPSQSQMTFVTKDVRARDIWPDLTSVYIQRIAGGAATTANPVVEFAGYIEKFETTDAGTTMVGVQSLDNYLFRRKLRTRRVYGNPGPPVSQTAIAASLVNTVCQDNGIPLVGVAAPSQYNRDRTYEAWDRKNVGEAITELSQVINGLDWEFVHTKTNGKWTTQMIFRDHVGTDTGVVLKSNREGAGYGMSVDAAGHVTLVDAIGEGEEVDMKIATAKDNGPYPQFDDAPAWKDIADQATLQDHADGWLELFREPVAVPAITVAGLDPDPAATAVGDVVLADINHGSATHKGPARISDIAWTVAVDAPDLRTYALSPLTRASESVLNQVASDDCENC